MARFTRTNFYPKVIVDGIEECDLLNNFFNRAFKIQRDVGFYTLRQQDIYRPDLLSYKFYGTPDLWWILYKFNKIEDVWNDLEVGKVIQVPDRADIEDFYSEAQKLK
jgi:hypothetical protein